MAMGGAAVGTAATYHVSGWPRQSRQTVVSWHPLQPRRELEYLNPVLKAGKDQSPLARCCSHLPSLTWRPGAPGGPGGPGAPGGPCNTPKHKRKEVGGEAVAGGGPAGAAQRGQHPPAGPAAAARTSRSTVLGLPGAERRGRAFSGGEAEPGGARGCSWCLPASRHSWGPGGGRTGRCTPRGLPAERGGEGREGGGLARGYGSTPTLTHLLAPGTLLPLRGGKPEMCISRRPLATPPVPPTHGQPSTGAQQLSTVLPALTGTAHPPLVRTGCPLDPGAPGSPCCPSGPCEEEEGEEVQLWAQTTAQRFLASVEGPGEDGYARPGGQDLPVAP